MIWDLDFWKSPEWQTCQKRLKDLETKNVQINPAYGNIFRSLSSFSSPEQVNVCIVAQDPYPVHAFATGLAFSIPPEYGGNSFPRTLREVFKEYSRDLGYPSPCHGDLSRWVRQGVLLYNAIPVTRDGCSLGCDWKEWKSLNREVFSRLSERGIVFCFIGKIARSYAVSIPFPNRVIEVSHPSPRNNRGNNFRGSRIFSTINHHLADLALPVIDWRLDETPGSKDIQVADLAGGLLLPNITGIDLGGHPRRPTPNLYRSEVLCSNVEKGSGGNDVYA